MTSLSDDHGTPSSSPSGPIDGGGIVFQNGVATGPIQLPAKNIQRFLDQFNATYASKNIRLTRDLTVKRSTETRANSS